MRAKIAAFLAFLALPAALFAREGTPSYYQNNYGQPRYQQMPSQYQNQNVYVGSQQSRQVVGQRSYSYQVPRQTNPLQNGGMTPNGVAIPRENSNRDLAISVIVGREFADFQFETGVRSILEWDDMIVNKIGLHVEKDFSLRDFDLFAFGEYEYGTLSHGGLSMDYDLMPYNESEPASGIFTISMGDQSGTMQNMKVGIGARHILDVSGWKISPIIGYQIFSHDLKMSNHVYPNPAVYIPLMNQYGDYIYGDSSGNYYSVPQGTAVPDDYYQVCMSPEDLSLAAADPNTHAPILTDSNGDGYADSLMTTPYDPLFGNPYLPWGVAPGECVVIGGDGIIKVDGTTHIYNTKWSGVFLGVEVEKQMTYVDKLRFYAEVSMPHYKSEGIWPNRTDWQQNPSFIDEGDSSALHYQLEMEYIYQFSDRLQLSIKANTRYFYVGAIPGKLFVAGYQYYVTDADGNLVYQDTNGNGLVDPGEPPQLATQDPYVEKVSDSLRNATWQSFGLHFGVKYAF
ncbi:MAG: hypothetical protein LBT45_03690 [Rickettsiales bacterium]|jgi:hypothetical protein|nr:hypothetical protein [Rickettsiales bacterium]